MNDNLNPIKTSLWDLLQQLDIMSAGVMILLALILFICSTLVIFKFMSLHIKQKQFNKAWALINNAISLEDLLEKSALLQRNFIGNLLIHYLAEFKSFLRLYDAKNLAITDQDWQSLQSKLYQGCEQEVIKEEGYCQILATAAAIAPLLGLFGTVWGLINSFLSVGEQASNSLSSVGSGIAQALLTTIAGLVVAIPALVAYNYIMSQLKLLESNLIQVTDKSSMIMRMIIACRQQERFNPVYSPAKSEKQQEL